jgi:hypothetical protein
MDWDDVFGENVLATDVHPLPGSGGELFLSVLNDQCVVVWRCPLGGAGIGEEGGGVHVFAEWVLPSVEMGMFVEALTSKDPFGTPLVAVATYSRDLTQYVYARTIDAK